MLMLATLKGYGFRWPLGADRLMLASVGTGLNIHQAQGRFGETPPGHHVCN